MRHSVDTLDQITTQDVDWATPASVLLQLQTVYRGSESEFSSICAAPELPAMTRFITTRQVDRHTTSNGVVDKPDHPAPLLPAPGPLARVPAQAKEGKTARRAYWLPTGQAGPCG